MGGAIAGLTIVRNRCNGTGVTTNGVQSGRAGGLFVREKANIANCVIWGNKCNANRDIQYANARSVNDNAHKPDMKFCSLSNADLCDWSGTQKKQVRSLHSDNDQTASGFDPSMGYPIFINPVAYADAGCSSTLCVEDGSGQCPNLNTYNWRVSSESALHHAGIQTIDLDNEGETESPADTYDVTHKAFNPRATLGAFVSSEANIGPEVNGSVVNFYVDPNHVFGRHTVAQKGYSWDEPTRFLGNVLELIAQDAKKASPVWAGNTINIYIKEGTVDNTDSYSRSMRVRNVSLNIPSNVNIYGGYPSSLTGTDVSQRNPRLYQTIITGDVMGDYNTNVSHLVRLNNASNVLIDGIQIRESNASSRLLASSHTDGAALTINGGTNIRLKNVLIANNQAEYGAAVLAENGAQVQFENCIFHNNTSTNIRGIITSRGASNLTFDHCDVLRNVGYASWLEGTSTNVWNNSILYGNLDRATENTNVAIGELHPNALPAFGGAAKANVTGEHCMFDAASAEFSSKFTGTHNKFDLSYRIANENDYPRFINPTRNSGHSVGGDVTFYGRSTSFEPHNLNPIVNAASYSGAHDTWGWDMTTLIQRSYGGLPDIGALENHRDEDPTVENAYTDGHRPYGEILYVRDYTASGTPGVQTYDKDAGGNLTLNAEGKGCYNVAGEEFDGSSWERAINGNAIYSEKVTINKRTVVAEGHEYMVLARSGRCLSVVNDKPMWTLHASAVPFSFELEGGYYLRNDVYYPVYYIKYGDKYIAANPSSADDRTSFVTDKTLAMPFALVGVDNTTSKGFNIIPMSNTNISLNCRGNSCIGFWTNTNQGDNGSSFYFVDNSDQSMPVRTDVVEQVTTTSTYRITSTNGNLQATVERTDAGIGGENGLQHAVEIQRLNWIPESPNREVWVGAGIYAKDNTSRNKNGDNSCFIIRDHVNVYGAFPKTGNPCKNERHPLLSQYVYNTDSSLNPNDYETILEPITKTMQEGAANRVLAQPENYNSQYASHPNYDGCEWDGFTIRNGVLDANMVWDTRKDGGAALAYYYNVTVRNFVITNNTQFSAGEFRGGAVYIGGGTAVNLYIINNKMASWDYTNHRETTNAGNGYGAGAYLRDFCTMYNCVVSGNVNNTNKALGAGLFLDGNANFYNNTVVKNTALAGAGEALGGIAVWTSGPSSTLNMYNCIVYDNVGLSGSNGSKNIGVPTRTSGGKIYIYNTLVNENDNVDYDPNDGRKLIKYIVPKTATNASDVFRTIGSDFKSSDYRLIDGSIAINTGLNDVLFRDTITNSFVDRQEDLERFTDMDYTARVQDCNIDLGAYEYNTGAFMTPEVIGDVASFYVTPEGFNSRNAGSPENATCAANLQKTIDAAGRYKYLNPTKKVIVKVANSYELLHPNNGTKVPGDDGYVAPKDFKYYAIRTTNQADDNVRIWSIIIPRGVEVWGGYTDVPSDNNRQNWTAADNGFKRQATQADVDAGKAQTIGEWIDLRNITCNPTYFDSYYQNKVENTSANCYHVVTFTDRVFDAKGNPYMQRDLTTAGDVATLFTKISSYDPLLDENENLFVHMSDVIRTGTSDNIENINLHRAVLDGIFVTGGQADALGAGSSATLNINQYGGAAIVTPYAHVRNCILKGNRATNGGALALMDRALVSGSIMVDNNASGKGGALYVFEDGDKLSDGTTVDSSNPAVDNGTHTKFEYTKRMDYKMAHVFTSTIVRNNAGVGGGVWFTEDKLPNVRLNSVAIWQNSASDQANVAGMIAPEKLTTDNHSSEEYYPFAFSAVQDIRVAGAYNFSVDGVNSRGIRFATQTSDLALNPTIAIYGTTIPAHFTDGSISQYFGPIEYSTLVHSGMSAADYGELVDHMALSESDIMSVSRSVNSSSVPRTYIEVGARAIDKMFSRTQPMYRLFVAKAEDVDMVAAKALKDAGRAAVDPGNEATEQEKAEYAMKKYYGQEGSSFAFPFQSLQDALDYIHLMRYRGDIADGVTDAGDGYKSGTYDDTESGRGKMTNALADGNLLNEYHANNIPFEIFVSRGTYHPKRDLVSNTDHALSATFTIPEGVSIYGGLMCTIARDEHNAKITNAFYGKGFSAVNNTAAGNMITPAQGGATQDIYNNVTNITGTGNQQSIAGYTILEICADSIATRRENHDLNANSIIEPWEFTNQTILSGEAAGDDNNGLYHVVTIVPDENIVGVLPVASEMYNPNTVDVNDASYAMHTHMRGQMINLDGLQIQGGYAFHYVPSAFDDDPFSDYNYYHGGGLLVDGNRYCDTFYGKSLIKNGDVTKVGKIEYKHLQRTNAIGYRDIPVNVKNCKFLNNRGGFGGAISTNTSMNIFQSSFEQNQAVGMTEHFVHGTHGDAEVHYPGNGGAIHATHVLAVFNTLFANNEAKNEGTPLYGVEGYKIEPQYFHTLRNESNSHQGLKILGGAGGAISMGKASKFHIMNCDFVKNKANIYPAVFTMNPNTTMNDATNILDYNQFANTVFWGNEVNEQMLTKHKSNTVFTFASNLFCNVRSNNYKTGDYNPKFIADYAPQNQAALDNSTVFAETAWFCAYEAGRGKSVNHNVDKRGVVFNPTVHLDTQYPGEGGANQNCNVLISSENSVLEGPNFVNPSHKAGVDGYMESADWSPARINNLTDNGSGKIMQTISNNGSKYSNSFDTYENVAALPERSVYNGGTGYTNENVGDFMIDGIYATARYLANKPDYRDNIALGSDRPYMKYVKNEAPIYRISYDPNPSHDQTYVDIGVYEYVHTQLKPNEGDEVDILWVSTDEKPENGIADGHEWSQPTSDLQRAIETLLASRNGHRKEIRLMDGTFTPIYTIEGNLSFYIDTYKLNGNVILPENNEHTDVVEDLGVKSLTIKGGYSRELENEYDVEKYPAIIKGQQRTNESAATWNHAFYIKDATQRYGKKGGETAYTKDNHFGATTSTQAVVQTIPIEIDGITFINDQAQAGAGVQGAALYYEAQNRQIPVENEADNDNTTTGASAARMNYEVVKYYLDPEHTQLSGNDGADPTLYATYNGVDILAANTPALILSKCKFYASGDRNQSKNTSAVYIGTKGAISSLIYNNVFHTNYGNPLEAYNAKTINNTYALNGGYVNLMNDASGASTLLNSALWKNNDTGAGYGVQAVIAGTEFGGVGDNCLPGASSTIFNNNAVTLAAASVVEPTDANSHNASLANDNTDLFNGPNFIDPENAIVENRNFNILPSFRLLNQGLNNNYKTNVVVDKNANHVVYDASGNILEYAWDPTTDKDAALNTRIYDNTIDVGAYEYQNQLQRIFYVDPNKVSTDATDNGKTWEKALGFGQIQDAINMAGLYHHAHDTELDKQEAYVYVRGASATNKGMHTGETLNLQDGVKVFGGLPASYKDECEHEPEQEATNDQATAYETKVINDRHGVADPSANKTTIAGIRTDDVTKFNSPTVVDGFVVSATTPDNPTGTITDPVINVNPQGQGGASGVEPFAIRNVIVHDNDASADVNVVNINNALIYEVLMRDNKVSNTGAVMQLGTNGYAVNVTVEGKSVGANSTSPLNGGTEADTHIFSSLVNYADDAKTKNTLSGFNYILEDKNLNYQLAEGSRHIDACNQTTSAFNPQEYLPEVLRQFISYGTDRDLLGNPRLLCGVSDANMIDRGAFETWKVTQSLVTTGDGTNSVSPAGWTGTHYYPHDGSVVYVMQGNNLNSHHDMVPGFLLVQNGASVFGNGKAVNAAYVAVERNIRKDGNIVALPYAMRYTSNAAATPAYDGETGVLSLTETTSNAYCYNGTERSAWDYIFTKTPDESKCWEEIALGATTEANVGVLYLASNVDKEKNVRFTGKGAHMGDYIYTENGLSKTVVLRKYDDTQSTNNNADYTDNLNMGWNCFGLPYLVSNYRPYDRVDVNEGANTVTNSGSPTATTPYRMNVPHTLWMYYDHKDSTNDKILKDPNNTDVNGDGGYYSVDAWKPIADDAAATDVWHTTQADARIWVGEGLFTQTATHKDSESLVFYRPVYVAPVSSGAKSRANVRYYGLTDTDEEQADEEVIDLGGSDATVIATEYYTTGGVRIARPQKGLVIIRNIYSDGTSKSSKVMYK